MFFSLPFRSTKLLPTNYAEMRRKTLYAFAFSSLVCWILLIQYLFSERLQKKVSAYKMTI